MMQTNKGKAKKKDRKNKKTNQSKSIYIPKMDAKG